MTYCICAFVERWLTGDMQRNTGLGIYAFLACLTASGMYFTNASLAFLSYPARIIFKSGKPIPTMGVEYVYVGKRYGLAEILSVVVLTGGIVCFAQGEISGHAGSDSELWGFIFISLGVLFDALTSNYEKKKIFSEYSASHTEVIAYSNIFATVLAFLSFTQEENFWSSGAYIMEHPEIIAYITISAVGGYFSISFVLMLIQFFSPTYAECVKGCRKVLSIAAS